MQVQLLPFPPKLLSECWNDYINFQLKNVSFQFLSLNYFSIGRMPKMTTSVRAFDVKLKRSSVQFRQFAKANLAQIKNVASIFVAQTISVVCSLTGKASHCECEECEFKSRQNHPNLFPVAKHKGCALVCRTRRCEFESRRYRQNLIKQRRKNYDWKLLYGGRNNEFMNI